MIFHSLDFLVFVVITLAAYWSLPLRGQNVLLLVASYVFYGWVHPWFLGLIFATTFIDYWSARSMAQRPEHKKAWLIFRETDLAQLMHHLQLMPIGGSDRRAPQPDLPRLHLLRVLICRHSRHSFQPHRADARAEQPRVRAAGQRRRRYQRRHPNPQLVRARTPAVRRHLPFIIPLA